MNSVNHSLKKLFTLALMLLMSLMTQLVRGDDAVVIASADFEDGVVPKTGMCTFGSQGGGDITISRDTQLNYRHSLGSIKGTYPIATGGMYVWGGCDIGALNTRDVYIEFSAKMPKAKQGLKFLKIFGQRVGMATANTTFMLDYTGIAEGKGSMYQVSFGDGTTDSNDTQNVINFNGSHPEMVGRSKDVAIIKTPQNRLWSMARWGDKWHHFRVHLKYNSGTSPEDEVADGEYYVEIDGTVYVDAQKIFNRHPSNLPIKIVGFFDWAQGGTEPFEVWYDDIWITSGGFHKVPKPPNTPSYKVK